MNRLHTIDVNDATGELAELFAAIKNAIGKVPNAFATLGSNSPALLAQSLKTNELLQSKSMLSRQELEAINLAISEHSGCDYCVAAHTLTGKAAGFTVAQTKALRSGSYAEDPKIDALVRFSLLLARTSGTLPVDAIKNVRGSGYSDRQIVEAIAAISAILFTNMLNRANDTTLDFPRAD